MLLVDDNEHLLNIMELLLESNGYQVRATTSPLQAAMMARDDSFDVLISDMRMPQLSGVELVREVRASPGNTGIAVMLLSGQSADDFPELAGLSNVVFMRKPFAVAQLLDALQALHPHVPP